METEQKRRRINGHNNSWSPSSTHNTEHTFTYTHTHPELLSLYVVIPGAHNEANEMPPSLVQPEPLLKKSKSLEVMEGDRGGGGRGKEGGQRRRKGQGRREV